MDKQSSPISRTVDIDGKGSINLGPKVSLPAVKENDVVAHVPMDPDVLWFFLGGQARRVAHRLQAISLKYRRRPLARSMDNDASALKPIRVRLYDGQVVETRLIDELILNATEQNMRDLIRDYPLLSTRYFEEGLLRGISVLDTYKKTGYGGHSYPVVSMIDFDLNGIPIFSHVMGGLRQLRDDTPPVNPRSGNAGWVAEARKAEQTREVRRKRVAIVGGTSGSFSPAGLRVLPYLVRDGIQALGMANVDTFVFPLGIDPTRGLTENAMLNSAQTIFDLGHLQTFGIDREFVGGKRVATQAPVADRVIFLNDPEIPAESGKRASDADLDRFEWDAAKTLFTFLHTDAANQFEAYLMANAQTGQRVIGTQGAWIGAARASLAGVDKSALKRHVQAALKLRLLEGLEARLTS